jgi:hypothetical protein
VSAPTFTGTSPTAEDVTVTDDDSAASNGVALYANILTGVSASLWFVSPTNADGTGALASGGNSYFVKHDGTAGTVGTAIYFDEDAANADERFLINSPSTMDVIVPVGGDVAIRLDHTADAATNGVQVYYDEDNVLDHAKLLFVSPTNADGTGSTDDVYHGLPVIAAGSNSTPTFTGSDTASEVSNGTDLSTNLATVPFEAVGR